MDQKLFLLLSGLSGQYLWFDKLIYFCAVILPWLSIAVFVVWVLFQKTWLEKAKGILVLFSAGLVWWLASLFKYSYFSPRPFMELFENKPLFTMDVWWDSLPSGHAVLFAALAGASLIFRNRKLGLVLSLVALVIAVARVVAGVHWPSDVVIGLILGGVTGYLLGIGLTSVFFANGKLKNQNIK